MRFKMKGAELRAENAELRRRLEMNSQNSHKLSFFAPNVTTCFHPNITIHLRPKFTGCLENTSLTGS